MADDLNRPYIGYRSAGRRPESQQDRRSAADAPLSAIRGMVSGVLGAPGDIESLIRMLPGLSEQTVLPTSEDVEKRLPMRELNQTPTGKAFTTAGQLGGGFYAGPGSPLRAIAGLPSAVSRAGRDFLMSTSPVHVVKPKGGNWLAGSVERAIEPMRSVDRQIGSRRSPEALLEEMRSTYTPEAMERLSPETVQHVNRAFADLEPKVAMNRWLETKLGKYVRNEMATPEDPLRALAEKGVLHYEPSPTGYNIAGSRVAAGFPEEGMGTSPLAKTWEDRADTFINELRASDITRGYPAEIEKNPWLLKVPPETRVYDMLRGADEDLGFAHLADELRNAINPASGLPENLLWKYQDLEKVTVPQAVERVAKINEWRAAQKAEADMARAMGPATQVVKEYPEQGFKWVELRQPKEPVSLSDDTLRAHMTERDMTPDEIDFVLSDPQTRAQIEKMANEDYGPLADALKYEGETMGHCVGGYCPDVVEGRSRIYSLRDKKGQPHVTIEVRPGRKLTEKDMPDDVRELLSEQYGDASREEFEAAVQNYLSKQEVPDEIVQIKGKANRAPKEEYLPAVQDFIKSGNWGRIGDAQNAGMRKFTDVFSSNELRMLQDAGAEFPNSGWLTGEDIQRLHNMITPEGRRLKYDPMGKIIGGEDGSGFSNGGAVRGYKAGGVVRSLEDLHQRYAEGGEVGGANFPTDDFDPARIDAIVEELHALNAG